MQSTNGLQTDLILLLVIVAATLVRKGRSDPAAKDLAKRQRIRPLPLEWLDPVIAVVLVGRFLWRDMSKGVSYVALAILGMAVGIPIGLFRARVMFVRALPSSKSVILTRSTAE
jgi:hypothetical protein